MPQTLHPSEPVDPASPECMHKRVIWWRLILPPASNVSMFLMLFLCCWVLPKPGCNAPITKR